jgi:hypothetical protein
MKGLRMPRFPKKEAQIAALAESSWRGLFDHAVFYPNPPVGNHKGSKIRRRTGTTDGTEKLFKENMKWIGLSDMGYQVPTLLD